MHLSLESREEMEAWEDALTSALGQPSSRAIDVDADIDVMATGCAGVCFCEAKYLGYVE